MPKVAVLIPVYNAQEGLIRSLDSVDRQAHSFDIFVVDDGSNPAVSVEPSRYDHRIEVWRLDENGGVVAARNQALRRIVTGSYKYVALQDAGDLDQGERISLQHTYLEEHPKCAVVGSWAQFVSVDGEDLYLLRAPASSREIRRYMRFASAFVHPSCMIRLSVLKETGLYDSGFPVASDYELLFRICRSYPCANIQELLLIKEEHPDSISVSLRRRSLYYRVRVQLRYFDFAALDSYLGVLRSLVLLALPYRLVLYVKKKTRARRCGT